jgi:hypothetical protein
MPGEGNTSSEAQNDLLDGFPRHSTRLMTKFSTAEYCIMR